MFHEAESVISASKNTQTMNQFKIVGFIYRLFELQCHSIHSPGSNVLCSTLFSLPDETIVPPDVPSYLSSQGTLSERQDVCIRVEAGGGHQPNGHVVDATGT